MRLSRPPFTSVVDVPACLHSNTTSSPPDQTHVTECAGRTQRATVRVCPLTPPHNPHNVTAAALHTLVTTYTTPGDRVLLLPPSPPRTNTTPALSTDNENCLVETVFRLGRSAVRQPLRHATIPNRTTARTTDHHPTTALDRFQLIITGWPTTGSAPTTLADCAAHLTDTGTLALLTTSRHQQHDAPVTTLATLAGLTLTDRLVLLHQLPSRTPPVDRQRLRVVLGGHRRIHTDVLICSRTHPRDDAEAGHA